MRTQFLIDDDVRFEDGLPVIVEGPAEMAGNSFNPKPDNIQQRTVWRGHRWEHLLIALSVQAVVGLATGNWWAGAALGAGIFVGREHAQAEYRWIEHYGQGRRANLPWWGWADPRVWDVHSWFWNLSLPIAAVLLMAGVM